MSLRDLPEVYRGVARDLIKEGYKATDEDKKAIAKCNTSVGFKYMLGFGAGMLVAAAVIAASRRVSKKLIL